jgi:hypothetical protein
VEGQLLINGTCTLAHAETGLTVCNGADIHNADKVKWIDVKTKCTYENVEVIETILEF